jgi:hypothetical protein
MCTQYLLHTHPPSPFPPLPHHWHQHPTGPILPSCYLILYKKKRRKKWHFLGCLR